MPINLNRKPHLFIEQVPGSSGYYVKRKTKQGGIISCNHLPYHSLKEAYEAVQEHLERNNWLFDDQWYKALLAKELIGIAITREECNAGRCISLQQLLKEGA